MGDHPLQREQSSFDLIACRRCLGHLVLVTTKGHLPRPILRNTRSQHEALSPKAAQSVDLRSFYSAHTIKCPSGGALSAVRGLAACLFRANWALIRPWCSSPSKPPGAKYPVREQLTLVCLPSDEGQETQSAAIHHSFLPLLLYSTSTLTSTTTTTTTPTTFAFPLPLFPTIDSCSQPSTTLATDTSSSF